MNKGTKEGTKQEIVLVKELNRDKNSALWSMLDIDENRFVYAVRCSEKKLSLISKKKVLTKSDIFLIKTKNRLSLEDNYLDETILNSLKCDYEYIQNSGISVKEKKSKSFTYQKFTIETFYTIFSSYELGCAIGYYTTQKDFFKNEIMEKAWHVDKENIAKKLKEFCKSYKLQTNCKFDEYKDLKHTAILLTQHIIKNSKTISDFIFRGVGAFKDPFYASFIYKDGVLSKKLVPDSYSITTGSGRTKGVYTIVVKP